MEDSTVYAGALKLLSSPLIYPIPSVSATARAGSTGAR